MNGKNDIRRMTELALQFETLFVDSFFKLRNLDHILYPKVR